MVLFETEHRPYVIIPVNEMLYYTKSTLKLVGYWKLELVFFQWIGWLNVEYPCGTRIYGAQSVYLQRGSGFRI